MGLSKQPTILSTNAMEDDTSGRVVRVVRVVRVIGDTVGVIRV